MSTTYQTTNLTAILDAASNEYNTLTGEDLAAHPFSIILERYDSPDLILEVFRKQTQAFDKFLKDNDKLMACLTPIVNILFMFSDILGNGVGLVFSPAKLIFTGIGVLLGAVKDVIASYKTILDLFERIQLFLQRLNHYTTVPLTPVTTVLLGKIMAEVLSILALSTKVMKERRIKTLLKRLAGKTEVKDALARLDMLTKEEGLLMVARTVEATLHLESNAAVTERNRLSSCLRTWLPSPNPSSNHNIALDARHEGTTRWFIQDRRFEDWKMSGSLLWIRGKPGSGKTVLCSAIIEDIKYMRESKSALVAYYYFDSKDKAKRNVNGLVASLLLQLAEDSDLCLETLYKLYEACRNGLEDPSEDALTRCLINILSLPEQLPVYIIIDALDECPNDSETPSARERTLRFVQNLYKSNLSKLFACVISRPEDDIIRILNPLTSPSRRVSLHDEGGQREDIDSYIRFFVHHDFEMRRWRNEDKELVINSLSERATGMFRWVHCQLDHLRRCLPSSIRTALNDLPITLYGTYERILDSIPRQKRQHASRLFQCMVAAIRPLRVEELTEMLAIDFGPNAAPKIVGGWRPERPEETLLSMCSTLIAIVNDEGTKVVQFSHLSVKEFLTSDHLRLSDSEVLCNYYIPMQSAHTILARACLTTLLQLDEKVNQKQLAIFHLAFYAAHNWAEHARFGVALQLQDYMELLFNPKEPYFQAWLWIHDLDEGDQRSMNTLSEHPSPPKATPLYYAVSCGFNGLAERLIIVHGEDVNVRCGRYGTPLHAASSKGHVDAVRVLLEHGADGNAKDQYDQTPLFAAYYADHLKVIQLLLDYGVNVESQSSFFLESISHDTYTDGWGVIRRLSQQMNRDVQSNISHMPSHFAPLHGQNNVT